MTKQRWLIVGFMVIFITGLASLIVAQQENKPMNMEQSGMMAMPDPPMGMQSNMGDEHPIMMWERISKALELTPEQKKSIETIFLDTKKMEIKLKADLEIQHIDLYLAFQDQKISDEKIKEIAKKIGGIQASMEEAKIDGILKARKMLTPEQREKAMKMFLHMQMHQSGMGESERPMMMQRGMMMERGMMTRPGMGMMRPEMKKEQMEWKEKKSGEMKEKEESEENEKDESK